MPVDKDKIKALAARINGSSDKEYFKKYFYDGGAENPKARRKNESISDWRKRLIQENREENEIYGGQLNPSVVYASPSTKKGIYKMEKSLRAKGKTDTSERAINLINDYTDALSGTFITDPDIAIGLADVAEYFPHPNAGEREVEYNNAKQQYLDSLFPGNDIFSQVYRWYRRHAPHKPTIPSFRGTGADVVSLNDNVVRLTPDSKQATALANEFVESKYPSVLTAAEYKADPDRIVGDMMQFPVSNINYFAGIEDGKFRIDKLENFNDDTTVIPARNIKKDVPEIYGIRIDGLEDEGQYSGGKIRDTGYLDNIKNRIEVTSLAQYSKESFPRYLEKIGIDVKEYEEELDKAIGKYVGIGDKMAPGEPFYWYNHRNLSDLSLYDKAAINWTENYAYPMFEHITPKGGWPVDSEQRWIDPVYYGYHDISDEPDELRSVRERSWPYQQFEKDKEEFLLKAGLSVNGWHSPNELGYRDKKSYGFIDKDGNLHPISDYHADVLDGKTIIGNPNGSIFIGRLQDISKPQLDSLNSYLKDNPSRIFRSDLGSFNQYDLNYPSLDTYLKQYFEHPRADDPNVYVIGTTEPNKLWSKAEGGFIRKYDDGGPFGEDKMLWSGPKTIDLPKELTVKIPNKAPSEWYRTDDEGNAYIPAFHNITSDILAGDLRYYPNYWDAKPGGKFYRNKQGEIFLKSSYADPYLNLEDYEEIPYEYVKKLLPRHDYIGGDNYRLKTAQRIPGFIKEIEKRANAYGINPNLMLHRILREGYIDGLVKNYNSLCAVNQKGYFENPDLWNATINGFSSFGLDDAGSNLMSGKYSLLDPSVSWKEIEAFNEAGRKVTSVYGDLKTMLEIKAAEMAYRQRELAKRGLVGDAYVNAAYNRGLNWDRLNDADYVTRYYSVPDYGVFSKGGKIHIKESKKGTFTAAAKKHGKSVQAFASQVLANKSNYSSAMVKKANFARNASKWHADGGFIDNLYSSFNNDSEAILNVIKAIKAKRNKDDYTS